MNSTLPMLSALTTLSVKFGIAQGLLYEESPRFMMTQSFGGGQPQLLRDLRPIHVALMAKVEQGRVQLYWRKCGVGCGIHASIIPRPSLNGCDFFPSLSASEGQLWPLAGAQARIRRIQP